MSKRKYSFLCAGFLGAVALAAQENRDGATFDGTRATLEKWIETERVISKERADWVLAREMLGGRIELVEREITDLRRRIEEARASLAEADAKRVKLVEDRDALAGTARGLAETVTALERRVQDLLPRLPAHVAASLRPLTQALPAQDALSKPSLGVRYQNVVGIMNQIDRAHRELGITPEVRTLPDGRVVEVPVLHAGIACGWFATQDGTAAGTGAPDAVEWRWTATDGSARAIAAARAILANERPAEFVALPLPARRAP